MLTLLVLFFAGCSSPADTNSNDGNTVVNETGSGDTGSNVDSDVDTGEEVVGGNCGGPEPPKDSLWVCNTGSRGFPWPTAGGPMDLKNCLTTGLWDYWILENGKSATLTNKGDGRVLTCELDE